MKLIPLTSICVTVLLWFGILAGVLAMHDLRTCAETHPVYESSHIRGRPLTRVIGLTTPALVPSFFSSMAFAHVAIGSLIENDHGGRRAFHERQIQFLLGNQHCRSRLRHCGCHLVLFGAL
jgi:hypothetical protein